MMYGLVVLLLEANRHTQGLDGGGSLKDGVWDTLLLEKGAKHKSPETCSDNQDCGLVSDWI